MIIHKTDTNPSLFEPLEIDIDGRVYKVREMTLGALEDIQALQAEMAAGSATAIRRMLETIIVGEIDATVLRSLSLVKVQRLINAIVEKAMKPGEQEKNGHGPAGDQSH